MPLPLFALFFKPLTKMRAGRPPESAPDFWPDTLYNGYPAVVMLQWHKAMISLWGKHVVSFE